MPRTSDPDIPRTAKLLIDQHGAKAVRYAANHADHSRELGDRDGADVWHRIHKTIEELQRGPRKGEAVN